MADFVIRYDGPALAENRLPVRDLAPALLALEDLFHEARRIVDPNAPAVSLEVEAQGFQEGSFEAKLVLAQAGMSDVLPSSPMLALGNLLGIVTDASHGLFALAKWVNDKVIVGRSDPTPGTILVEDDHGNIFRGPAYVFDVYDSRPTRALMSHVVRPLRSPGIDSFEIERDEETVTVFREEIAAFAASEAEVEVLFDGSFEMPLYLVSPDLMKPTNKWHFVSGDQDIWARIEDRSFLKSVYQAQQERFGVGDVLHSRLHLRQERDPATGRITMMWTVLEVLRHDRGEAGVTPALPFPDQESPEDE